MEKTVKVLIVEDDAAIRQMYQTKLETEGFQVQTATNGGEGLTAAKQFTPDVVLLDIMMPDVTGIDFLTDLRKASRNDSIQVIVMTNLDDPNLRESLQGLITDYVVKAETTPGEIAEKIKQLVS